MAAREAYEAMIRDEVAPWFRESGFRKRRNQFCRADDQGWQVVDFQASQWGSRDDVRFTINVGLGVRELEAVEPGAQLGADLREVLESVCLPWLEARRSLDQLMALARDSPGDFPSYLLGRFQMLLERAGRDDLASEIPAYEW